MNKKLTKLLSVFVIAGAIGMGSMMSFAGCGHTHTAGSDWQSDETNHWHDCTAGDGEQLDKAEHVDADSNGKCDVCGYDVVSISTVEAEASKTEVTVGEKISLSASITGVGNFNEDVTWAITEGSDKATLSDNILTVTAEGTIKVQATAVGDTSVKSNVITIIVANTIPVSYEGPAAGPVAGSGQTTSTFNTSSNIGAPSTLAEDYTKGVFTVKAGSEVRARARTGVYSEDASATVDASAKFTHSVKNGNIEINAAAAGTLTIYAENGSSSSFASFKITGIIDDGYTFKAASGKVVKITFDIPAAGTYTLSKKGGTVDIYQMDFTFQTEATPYESIELVSKGTTDYLVTQRLDCSGVKINAVDENGVRHEMSIANCEFDTSKYNPNVAGEYEIGVTLHLASNLTSDKLDLTTSYTVKVYQVESISLYTISYASNKQTSLQQACVTGDTFSTDNLTVMAKCKLGDDTIDFKLKNDWYTVYAPSDFTTPGTKYAIVSVGTDYTVGNKPVEVSYEIVVKDKKEVVDNKVEITVGNNGEFSTLTQAIQYLKACNYSSSVYKVIKLEAGTYTEKVWLDVDNVTLVGQGATMDDTVVTYSAVEDTVDQATGNKFVLSCATMHVTGKNFKAYNLSIRNDFDYINEASKYGSHQGLALTIAGDGAVLYKTHLYGNQDTLYLKSRAYFYQSQIDGNVDFIFGEAAGLAYFDECKIVAINRSANDKGTDQNGYVTAMKADATNKPDYGYIFANCEFTDDGHVADGSMSLGRPWGKKATVAYINCSFTKAYATSGYGSGAKTDRWSSMSGNLPSDADFCEYGSTGDGAITEAVTGGSILTAEQAANYTKANIFAATNGLQTSTAWDCDAEYTKLRILAGLDQGEIPEETTRTVTLYELTTEKLEGATGEYSGYIIDATTGKFAPRTNDVQINEGVKIKFKVNAGTTAEQITVTFTAAAGSQYIPTCAVSVEVIEGETYAVLTFGSGYPSTMTIAFS
ncbi:MAG: pectinesterase family protein [Candidatus Coproplasma sp.]